tara:strand:- start:150 stop:554 length:405 start_codon:yes stop_codon:yes gene_type:complete
MEKKRKKLYKPAIKKNFKSKMVKARVSIEEFDTIKAKANTVDLTVSEFLRRRVLSESGAAFNPKDLINYFFQYTGAVNKVGVNINQATNYLNFLKIQGKGGEKEVEEFNRLFHRYLILMTELNSIMKRELKKIK